GARLPAAEGPLVRDRPDRALPRRRSLLGAEPASPHPGPDRRPRDALRLDGHLRVPRRAPSRARDLPEGGRRARPGALARGVRRHAPRRGAHLAPLQPGRDPARRVGREDRRRGRREDARRGRAPGARLPGGRASFGWLLVRRRLGRRHRDRLLLPERRLRAPPHRPDALAPERGVRRARAPPRPGPRARAFRGALHPDADRGASRGARGDGGAAHGGDVRDDVAQAGGDADLTAASWRVAVVSRFARRAHVGWRARARHRALEQERNDIVSNAMSRLFLGFGLLALLSSAALAFSDDELRAIYVEMKQ